MNSIRAVASFFALSLCVAAMTGACGDDRDGLYAPTDRFDSDASVEEDAAVFDCLRQCSLDGRSVVDTCTGQILEQCPPELACGAGVCQKPCDAAAADRSSNGCEFYLQPPFVRESVHSCYAAYVVNTSTLPVELSLELAGKKLDISKATFTTQPGGATLVPHEGTVPPGESVIVFVSDLGPGATGDRLVRCPNGVVAATVTEAVPRKTGIGASFHLTASAPISLSAIYPFGGASSFIPSATLLLPVATWGTQNIIVNSWGATFNIGSPGAQIVASEDGTEVTIRPTEDIQGGVGVAGTAAFAPSTYRIDKGQVLQLVQDKELTGSVVMSNKPTSIFGGHECMNVPESRSYCDTALQQLPSLEQWGSEYATVGYRPRLGDDHEQMPYRIVAARDGTRLDYDPAVPRGAPVTVSAGQVVTFYAGAGEPFVVRTQDVDHPVYLAAYMSGSSEPTSGDPVGNVDFLGNGDPEFVNVIPAGQYLSSYSFYADPTYRETSLVIVRAKSHGELKDVTLECAGTLTDFRPLGTRGDYEYTRVDLARKGGPGQTFGTSTCTNGVQHMTSEGPFTATLWGWAPYASYAYPGGMAQRKLVQTPLAPIR